MPKPPSILAIALTGAIVLTAMPMGTAEAYRRGANFQRSRITRVQYRQPRRQSRRSLRRQQAARVNRQPRVQPVSYQSQQARSQAPQRVVPGPKQPISFTQRRVPQHQAQYVVDRTSPGETRETMRRVLGQPHRVDGSTDIYEIEPNDGRDLRVQAAPTLVLIYSPENKLQSKYR